MKVVKLKNGSEEAEVLVHATMTSLRALFQDKVIVAYELCMLCRDSSHKLFGKSGDDLKALALIQPDGRVHDSIRNVVLSAFEGDGPDMKLVTPVASE